MMSAKREGGGYDEFKTILDVVEGRGGGFENLDVFFLYLLSLQITTELCQCTVCALELME